MIKKVYMIVEKNTSLRDTLRTDSTLAAQVHRKYGPARFKALAGVEYVAPPPTPPPAPKPPTPPKIKRKRKVVK